MEVTLQPRNNILLGKVQGFLEAFALFNTKTNHGYTFEFDCLTKSESVEQTLHRHLSAVSGIKTNSLSLTLISDVQEGIQAALSRWFFEFLSENDSHSHLVDPHKSFSLSHKKWRNNLIAELAGLICEAARPSSVFKVDFDPVNWYEYSWEDFAFENQEQVFFLHLGVSD